MSFKKVCWCLVALVCAHCVQARPAYFSQRLELLASRVQLCLPDSLPTLLDDEQSYTFQGRPLRVCTNLFGDVSHIGYRMFAVGGLPSADYVPLLHFIERYCLELDLPADDFLPSERMELDHVAFVRGNLALLQQSRTVDAFTINEWQRRLYRIGWRVGQDSVVLTVPMDFQLLSGATSIEQEWWFERDVQRFIAIPSDAAIGAWEGASPLSRGEYRVACVGQYLSTEIRSDVYLKKQHHGYVPVYDSRQPLISLTNLLLTGCSEQPVALSLVLNRYGGQRSRFEITLQQLLSYFSAEGCTLYVGVKSFDGVTLQASLFALQPHLAYNHLVSFTVPVQVLHDGSAKLRGVAYTYVPLQNVAEGFFMQDFTKQ